MSDRTSASLFAEMFTIVAEYVPEPQRDEVARRLWKLTRDYDFSPYQMYADEALMKLGLARRGVDSDWPNDGEVVLYGPEDES